MSLLRALVPFCHESARVSIVLLSSALSYMHPDQEKPFTSLPWSDELVPVRPVHHTPDNIAALSSLLVPLHGFSLRAAATASAAVSQT